MYRAKVSRRPFDVYEQAADDGLSRMQRIHQLRQAIEARTLELRFQPQFDLRTGEVPAVEALLRWPHPELGLIRPTEFLPLAEEAGLIKPLTDLVLDSALAECAGWHAAGHAVAVSVNLSTTSLLDVELPNRIRFLLARNRLGAEALILEITETTLMADRLRARQVVQRLHDLGLTVSIDDFGTGFSSLAYVSDLAVGELKIDRELIRGIASADNQKGAAVVRATIELGHSLGLRVVAEGVEDADTYEALVSLGCDLAQGFFLGEPKSADQLSFPSPGSRPGNVTRSALTGTAGTPWPSRTLPSAKAEGLRIRRSASGQPGQPPGHDVGDLGVPLAQSMVPIHEHTGHRPGNGHGLPLELGRRPEGIPCPRHEEARHAQIGKVRRPQAIGLSRRMQWIADEDEGSHIQSLGRGQGAHPTTHGATPDGHPAGGDIESRRQLDRRAAHGLDAHLRRVGSAFPGCAAGEFDALDRDAETARLAVHRHQGGLVPPGTGTRGQHEADRSWSGHGAIMLDAHPAGTGLASDIAARMEEWGTCRTSHVDPARPARHAAPIEGPCRGLLPVLARAPRSRRRTDKTTETARRSRLVGRLRIARLRGEGRSGRPGRGRGAQAVARGAGGAAGP